MELELEFTPKLKLLATVDLELCAELGHPKVLRDVARYAAWEGAVLGLTECELEHEFEAVKAKAGYVAWKEDRQMRFRRAQSDACKAFRHWDLVPLTDQLEFVTDEIPVSTLASRIDGWASAGFFKRRRKPSKRLKAVDTLLDEALIRLSDSLVVAPSAQLGLAASA
jgi:hypothetical protein